jgi:hypothetical protein
MRLYCKALGLMLTTAMVIGTSSCKRFDNSTKYHVGQGERDQVLQAERDVLEAEPQLKAEQLDLEKKLQEAKNQHGLRSDEYSVAAQEYDAFEREKLRPKAEKANPSFEAIYARMDLDRSNTRSDGFIEFAQENVVYKIPWRICIDLTTILALGYGVYLLFRPPTLGSANMLLSLALLPSTLLGFAVIENQVMWLESKQSGIYDFPVSTGHALSFFDHLIWTTYEIALPSLFIYVWLLIQIANSSKKSPTTETKI